MERIDYDSKDTIRAIARINNTVLIEDKETGKISLVNINTNEEVMPGGKSYQNYKRSGEFFVLEENQLEDSTKKYVTYVSIYDPIQEKIIVDKWIKCSVENQGYIPELYFLCDPKTNKMHTINTNYYRLQTLEYAFDSAEFLGKTSYEIFFGLINNGKKMVYWANRDELPKNQLDNVRIEGSMFIITEGDKEYFGFFDIRDDKIDVDQKRGPFDKAWTDENDRDIIYGKKGSTIEVYRRKYYSIDKMFSVEADNLHYLESFCCTAKEKPSDGHFYYFFDKEVQGKHGVIREENFNKIDQEGVVEDVTPVEFDKIEEGKDIYVLQKGEKKGYYLFPLWCPTFIEAKYDGFKPLFEKENIYGFEHDGLIDIYDIQNQKMIVSDCKIILKRDEDLIFAKDGKQGALWKEGTLIEGYDNINPIALTYYEVTKDGKHGVMQRGKEVIAPEYKNATIHYYVYEENVEFNYYPIINLAIELENFDGTKKTVFYQADKKTKDEQDLSLYDKVEYYQKMLVYRKGPGAYLYDFQGDFIGRFDRAGNIIERTINVNGREMIVYLIEGRVYTVSCNKVVELKDANIYRAAFVGDYGVVVIEDIDPNFFELKIAQMESMNDNQYDAQWVWIYNNSETLRKKYPDLLRK